MALDGSTSILDQVQAALEADGIIAPQNTLDEATPDINTSNKNPFRQGADDQNTQHEARSQIMAGAGGSHAEDSIAAPKSQAAKEKKEKEQAKRRAADAVMQAAISMTIDPETFNGFMQTLDSFWTQEAEEAENAASNSIITLINTAQNTRPEQDPTPEAIEEYRQTKETVDNLKSEVHRILENNNKDYAALSSQEQDTYLQGLLAERLAEKDPNMNVEQAQDYLTALKSEQPAQFYTLVAQIGQTALKQHASNQVFTSFSRAVELNDEMKDAKVVSIDYHDSSSLFYEIYVGTGISEDGAQLLTDGDGPQKYYNQFDGKFEEVNPIYSIASGHVDGARLIEQMTGAEVTFDSLEDGVKNDLASLGITNEEELHQHILDHQTNLNVISVLMPNDAFTSIMAPYALKSHIEQQLADGQIFANDPRLEELIDSSDLITQQEEAIQALKDRVTDMQSNLGNMAIRHFLQLEISDLSIEISTAEMQLSDYKEALATLEESNDTLAELNQDIAVNNNKLDTLYVGGMSTAPSQTNGELGLISNFSSAVSVAPKNFSLAPIESNMTSFSNTDLKIQTTKLEGRILKSQQETAIATQENAAAKVAELTEEIQDDGADTETNTPAPAPDTAQMFFDNNKAEIHALMLEGHPEGLSPDALALALKSMGASPSDIEKVTEMIANDPEMKVLDGNEPTQAPALTANTTLDPTLNQTPGMTG